MKKKIVLGLVALLILAQFKRIDRNNPPIEDKQDFFSVVQVDEGITTLIETSCYDCHSHSTSYPWYSHVAPVSWWLRDHIDEGRSHLNFSTWASLSDSDRQHLLEECQEVLEKKEMPMLPYMLMHGDAWIDEAERKELAQFFQDLKQS